ncbi:AAA family ATPase, putative [Plasmodium gallinaceum]|uniref:AAA family ATPase, putative n=1 Tax=Plasmodium gallinaceum TaxID=5849 RepID=A0A1J1GM01_PLAGA|nr:AAA family ATPase, putative [Plasmodium gallinaceum]CRG93380.1 AAA family ATPase, putative [Plasmodium gallinaceum]
MKNDELIENLCVYCNSNKSFSYFQKSRNPSKNLFKNEYEKLVNKKILKYKWIKNLSYNESLQYVLNNLEEWNIQNKEKCEQKNNTLIYKNKNFHIYNKKFLNDEKYTKYAILNSRRDKNNFKPKIFIDKILTFKSKYENNSKKSFIKENNSKNESIKDSNKKNDIIEENYSENNFIKKRISRSYTKENNFKNESKKDNNLRNVNIRENNLKEDFIEEKNFKSIFIKENKLNGEFIENNKLKNIKLKIRAGSKKKDIFKYMFNVFIRRKYYKKIFKLWLDSFLKRNGSINKKLAKKIINYMIIKNSIIFDVELFNFFFSKNLVNHFNTNLYFLIGKSGNKKKDFIKDLFLSFPFKYHNDDIFIIDIIEYEKYPIVCDYKYIESLSFSNCKKIVKNNEVLHQMNNKYYEVNKKNILKCINKPNFSFKIYNSFKIKNKYLKLINLEKTNNLNYNNLYINEQNKVNCKKSSVETYVGNLNELNDIYKLNNFSNYNNSYSKYATLSSKLNNNVDNYNSIKDNGRNKTILSIFSDNESASSFDLYNLKNNEFNKKIFSENKKYKEYKNKLYINKILYPYYYELLLKENAITNIKNRKEIEKINKFYMNLEYILISFTKIAVLKQLVWKKKNFKLLFYFLKKKKKRKKLNEKILGLNLFNGGYSFLLIKNFDYINNFSYFKKNCIMFLFLKYIYIWKNMNLNAHIFIISSTTNNNNILNNSSNDDNIISLFNSYMNNFFVFIFPNFLHKKDRYKLLTHLYKKNNLNYSKNQIKDVSKITNSFNIENLTKLFQDEYRERIISLLKKNKIVIKDKNFIKKLFQNINNNHFFSKVLNFQNDSHVFIHTHEIELYKKKDFKVLCKKLREKTYGFSEIIGENVLINRLKKEVIENFNIDKKKNATSINFFDSVGILIHGSSGSGKTFISKKIIEECNCNSIIINCSNIFNKIMGESEKFLNEIFEYAKSKLQPCIILLDAIENICFKENVTEMEKFSRRLKLCFYENIDKIHFEQKWKNNPCLILIIATTTSIDNIDDNLLMNHRIKYIYQTKDFEYWDNKDIYKLFQKCLKSNNIKSTDFLYSKSFQIFMSENIFKKKKDLSPLYISNLCRDTLIHHLQRTVKGSEIEDEIKVEDFYKSLRRMNY